MFTFDFGFETPGADWNDAKIALIFATAGEEADFGKAAGSLAVADASRYAEFFEAQDGLKPLDAGVYSELSGGADPVGAALARAQEAREANIVPLIVAEDRSITERFCRGPLIALWGKVGRVEWDEAAIFGDRETVRAGVRAATSMAFKSIPANVMVITARAASDQPEIFQTALSNVKQPVYLSIDLDVLAPGVAQTTRSLEPGGLSWYNLIDAIELVFKGPGVEAIELVGTMETKSRSSSALLAAQIIIKVIGQIAAAAKR